MRSRSRLAAPLANSAAKVSAISIASASLRMTWARGSRSKVGAGPVDCGRGTLTVKGSGSPTMGSSDRRERAILALAVDQRSALTDLQGPHCADDDDVAVSLDE